MTIKSIRLLCEMTFPSQTWRLWDGSGPMIGHDGEVWVGVTLNGGLDKIESALNGEAATLTLSMSGVDPKVARLAYEDLQDGEVIGAKVRLLIQDCDEYDRILGDPTVKFTGTIENMTVDDAASGDNIVSTVTVEVENRFSLRNVSSGSVLSDVDQQARAAKSNPGARAAAQRSHYRVAAVYLSKRSKRNGPQASKLRAVVLGCARGVSVRGKIATDS